MKTKYIYRAAALAASIALCFGFTAGCSRGDENNTGEQDSDHSFEITETGDYILQGGQTDYKIVLPADASSLENTAASELSEFFYDATGVRLETVTDDSVTYSEDARYLSIGENALSEAANVSTEGLELGLSGVYIDTEGKSVFMLGENDYGTLFSVCEFLSQTLNFEVFSENIIRLDEDVTEIPLMDYRIVDIPDFEYRTPGEGYIYNDTTLRNRMRMTEIRDFVKGQGGIFHNSFNYVSASDRSAHTKWVSTGGDQLCYTARGDDAEYQALVDHVAAAMEDLVIANPGIEYFSFQHEDSQNWCSCTECTEMINEYGGAGSVTIVCFLQDVHDAVMAWFETEEGAPYKCDFKITFLAYHGTNQPPTSVDENGEHSTINGLTLDGLVPYFAETNADYTVALNEGSVNANYASNLAGWSLISDEIFFWTYGTNFTAYLTPYNSFDSFQQTFQYAASFVNVISIYNQCQNDNAMPTSWERLKGYLTSKLAWNVDYDVEQLTEEFFEAYFGPAADTMRSVYDSYRVQAAFQNETTYNGSRSIFHAALGTNGETYWPKSLLQSWLDSMNAALDEIAYLENIDPELYSAYEFNIKLERLSPIYMMIELYDDLLTDEELSSLKSQFNEDVILTGISRVSEGADISEVVSRYSS